MRFLCDVHISIKISKTIEELGYFSKHVNQILQGYHTKDADISKYADDYNLILITKDQDFRNSYLLSKTPKKLLKINLGNISNDRLLLLIENNLEKIIELSNESDSFMIEVIDGGLLVVTR
jgi:predicted nuclease of predicted toxin-antitoxin system